VIRLLVECGLRDLTSTCGMVVVGDLGFAGAGWDEAGHLAGLVHDQLSLVRGSEVVPAWCLE